MVDSISVNKENSSQKKPVKARLIRILFFIAGSVFLGLGIIGIFIPILPTTPFLLLTAACYIRSSEKAYNWLLNLKYVGKYIHNYREGRGLPNKIKTIIIAILWITIIISIILTWGLFWVQLILLLVAVGVSIHIILIKPKKKNAADSKT